ncbi:MAG: hypothetical protein EZS28_027585 [Streblomastix strix]|uniref:NrS-1 polymerase-like helicase domain-containing protein n=1 Tax=Streblomastix strix TaxID=222440 RepID=A0A5J4V2C4_9EUKA|nr:MAG: hypothetical protein EZS28_027585 [Streblomastix strix]
MRILQADLMEIVRKVGNQNGKRFNYDISEFNDDSVNKLKNMSSKSRQVFFHVLSNKSFRRKEPILVAGRLYKLYDEPMNQIVKCIQVDNEDGVDVINNCKVFRYNEAGKLKTESIYEYIIKWFASIFQKVKLKIGTMMNFIGSQCYVKSFAIETIQDLFDTYALKNVDELNKIFGKFNSLASTAVVINFNEINDASEGFPLTTKMKSSITQAKCQIERKGQDAIEYELWNSYTGTFNDSNPILIEKGN